MLLFNAGNLITLGIVLLVLFFFRLFDKGSRSFNKGRKFIDRWKNEISAFVDEKGSAIRDYGITLDVERKSAVELMRRIQALTKEELNQKVQALTMIDDRIRDYDASLEELVQMTGRVQENLNRIRDESAFVENVGKRVNEIKEKVENFVKEIDSIGRKLDTMEKRFEQENSAALENAIEETLSTARLAIADLESNIQDIERKAREREEKLTQKEEHFEKLFTEAIDRAGSRAEKAEETAMSKLREQAQDRLNLIKTNFEEKIKSVQETIKVKLGEIHEQVKVNREEWKAETAAIETRQKAVNAEWKKDVHDINSLAKQHQDNWNRDIQEFTALAKQQAENLSAAIQKQTEEWEAASRNTGQEIITAAQERLEEYRRVQEEQFRQLSSVANDTAHLEVELRRSMQEAINHVNGDFTLFGKEIRSAWENSVGEFNGQLQILRDELTETGRELAGIKEKAFENVSLTLKGFEDEFLIDLSKRSAGIDQQLAAWQETLDKRLVSIAESAEIKRQKAETRITEETKKNIAAQGEKLVSDLERLKTETAAFEEGIREEMRGADESRKSFSEQLERDLEEVKNTAVNELNTKIGQHSLLVSDTLRQNQRDMETQINGLISDTKEQISGIESSTKDFRKTVEEWQTQYSTRMRELDDSMEEARRRSRELAIENDERFAAIKVSLDEIRYDISAQEKRFEHTDALKAELGRHVEDMSSNIDRLLQLKNEIAHFENQFTQIKRLEDDVNAKMTRFLSEKRRIEVMESDFTRLLQTSQSVEEKLAQVSNSDDVLQAMQIQIRRLEDAIKDTEEKYQRIERKSKTLEETNDGIDRNFKTLQEDEELIKKLEDTVIALKTDIDTIQSSVETLSADNEKARGAAEKLSTLDETVKWLEKRIAEMNVARESFARLATELQNLDKDAQDQLNLTRSLLNREEGKLAGRAAKAAGKGTDAGAPPPRDRENVIRLKRQGWKINEIAKSLEMSQGEVELILEMSHKDV